MLRFNDEKDLKKFCKKYNFEDGDSYSKELNCEIENLKKENENLIEIIDEKIKNGEDKIQIPDRKHKISVVLGEEKELGWNRVTIHNRTEEDRIYNGKYFKNYDDLYLTIDKYNYEVQIFQEIDYTEGTYQDEDVLRLNMSLYYVNDITENELLFNYIYRMIKEEYIILV